MKIIMMNDIYYTVIEETETDYILLPECFGEHSTVIPKSTPGLDIVADFKKFYEHYESKWDYTYDVYERGLTLRWFIEEKHPDYAWMFKTSAPQHISEIPKEIRQEYLDYLKESLITDWDIKVDEFSYTEFDAAVGFYENFDESDELQTDIAQLKQLIAEGKELEALGFPTGTLNAMNQSLLDELEGKLEVKLHG